MAPTVERGLSLSVKLALSFFISGVLLLNWLPQLDALAQNYLTDTISSNAIVFAVVRSLNGIISVVQSAEVSVGVASVDIGEIFDPVNDLIERFSGLLLVTLTALGIQQVLLLFTASLAMKIAFTLAAIVALILLWWHKFQQAFFLRLMLVFCLLRFLLAMQVGFVWLFDSLYFNATGEQALSVLEASAQVIETLKESITKIDLAKLFFGDNAAQDLESDDVGALISTSVVTLIVGMLFKSILIPIASLWAGLQLAKASMRS